MDEMASGRGSRVSAVRLYGGLIGLVSGAYAVYRSMGSMEMSGSAWFMLVLGAIVIVHGVVLFTPAARRLGAYSGPLMVVYAFLMLGHQAWLSMGANGMGGMDGMAGAGMRWDLGMVALALLMLASGLIMLREPAGER